MTEIPAWAWCLLGGGTVLAIEALVMLATPAYERWHQRWEHNRDMRNIRKMQVDDDFWRSK
jgi:hypothetical protein